MRKIPLFPLKDYKVFRRGFMLHSIFAQHLNFRYFHFLLLIPLLPYYKILLLIVLCYHCFTSGYGFVL